MDPCPFVRIVVGSLALRRPDSSSSVDSAGGSSCYCKVKLKGFPEQFSTVAWSEAIESRIHAGFSFTKLEFEKLVEKSRLKSKSNSKSSSVCGLKIEVFTGKKSWNSSGKLLGSVCVAVDLKAVEGCVIGGNKGLLVQNGWMKIESGGLKGSELHANVRAEPDPRFVFQFDGEPECSPQVFQVNGNVKQPVFSCKFDFRNSAERNNMRTRSSISESNAANACCFGASASSMAEKGQSVSERKGWSITIHDLSGSPVAAASMVTPFVPSPGSDKVSKSNPGAWLILRPGQGTWKPWGRLEAWREPSRHDHIGYRFELIPDGSIDTITLATSSISCKNGGKFAIDVATGMTPMTSPNSSFDLSSASSSGSGFDMGSGSGSGSWAHLLYRGFVMSSTLNGDGKCSKPEVEIGVPHVSCTEDAAAFVALAAALDLSIDACRSFSQKLRKELRQTE